MSSGSDAGSRAKIEKERLCLECRRCCTELSVYTHPILYSCDKQRINEFYAARGFTVEELDEDAIVLSLKHTCPHLGPEGCDIYETRPAVCREYSGIADFGDECLWSRLED